MGLDEYEVQFRSRMLEMMIADGRAPLAFMEHFQKTGELDGTLWPIRVPIVYKKEG